MSRTNGRQAIYTVIMAGSLFVLASGVGASRPNAAPNMLRLMLSCRGLSGDAERLACFDKQVDALSGRITAGSVIVVDKIEARKAERARFGLPPSGNAAFSSATGGEELNELVGTVSRAQPDGYGKWIVTLADGTRWHQLDDYPLSQTPRAGVKAIVRHAALGSFKMTIGTNAAIRVRREA